jgi:hypothetical protein
MMDFLCSQLEMRLHEHYKLNYDMFNIFEEFHKITNKIEDKKLIAQYESILIRKIKYAEYIYFNVYFDISSNRLNVDCNSHSYFKKHSKQFKQYWERPKSFDNWAHYINMFKLKGYNVGKTNEIREKVKPSKHPNGSFTKPPPIIKYPRYEDLRGFIYKEIDLFEFHYGYSFANYNEDNVIKELAERLRIRIFQGNTMPKRLYREYYDGNWKKILSP